MINKQTRTINRQTNKWAWMNKQTNKPKVLWGDGNNYYIKNQVKHTKLSKIHLHVCFLQFEIEENTRIPFWTTADSLLRSQRESRYAQCGLLQRWASQQKACGRRGPVPQLCHLFQSVCHLRRLEEGGMKGGRGEIGEGREDGEGREGERKRRERGRKEREGKSLAVLFNETQNRDPSSPFLPSFPFLTSLFVVSGAAAYCRAGASERATSYG